MSEDLNTPKPAGVLEQLIAMAPHIESLAARLHALESHQERSNKSAAVTMERAAELITGEPYGTEGCINVQTVKKLVDAGHLRRIPGAHIRKPVLIIRESIYEYTGKIEPEY